MLDLGKIEAAKLEVLQETINLDELALSCARLCEPLARRQSISVSVEPEPGTRALAWADRTRVRQVLFNLLSNAIKFTEQGGVRLEIAVTEAAPGTVLQDPEPGVTTAEGRTVDVDFRVVDSGPGMDADTLARLFQRFSQGDESLSRRHGGTGLGLEISRNLARLMGGDVNVSSRLGQGSTFVFRVPLPVLPETPQGPAVTPASSPDQARTLRVLVAEDNEVNRMVMEAILGGMGHDVGFAENGEQAVQMAADQDWDIVLMDLHMPVMDGLEATRAIRAQGHARRAAVPVVALTADVFVETRERCLAAGVQAFLTKPVDTAELAACLTALATPPR